MADKKISQLAVAGAVSSGDLFAIAQTGVTKQLDYAVLVSDFLLKSDNLAGLASAASARANLGNVLTATEVQTKIDVTISANLDSYVMQDSDSVGAIAEFAVLSKPLALQKIFGRIFWTGQFRTLGALNPADYLFDIPVGFRPESFFHEFIIHWGTTQAEIQVSTDGVVNYSDVAVGAGSKIFIANIVHYKAL